MKTRSNRFRVKEEGELVENARSKALFKGMQIGISVFLNTLLFYIVKMAFLSDEIYVRIFQVFGIVIVSVLASNAISVAIVMYVFKVRDIKQFLAREGSIAKFFITALIYSFVTAICFSFGVFTLLYSAYGDGTMVTLLAFYAIFYFVAEFFSYGIVTWAMNLSNSLKRQRGG